MKIQNSILSMGLAVALLSSCSTEDLIDRPLTTDGPVSVVFYRTAMETKADKAGNYDYATDEELNIKNYTIAVFEGTVLAEDAVCIKLVSGTTSGASTTVDAAGNTVTAYSVPLTDLPAERNLQFLLIANATTVVGSDYVGKRYSEFKGLTETTSSFRADALVKVGTAPARFEVSATPQEVKIPLTQLSARLDFGGVTVEGGNSLVAGPSTTTTRWDIQRGTTIEALNIPSEANYSQTYSVGDQTGSYRFDTDSQWYTYATGEKKSDRRWYRQAVVLETETKTWQATGKQFVFTMDRLEGVNFASDLAIFSTSEIENRQNKEDVVSPNEQNRFYTYENCHLRFVFTGSYGPAVKVTKQQTRTRKIVVREQAESTYKNKKYKCTWRNKLDPNDSYFTIIKGSEEDNWSDWSEPVTVSDSRSAVDTKADSKQFELVIDRDKIKKGHLYRITGKGTPTVDLTPEIVWEVVDLTPTNVNVPGFE